MTYLCNVIVYLNQWLAEGLLVSSVSISVVQVSHVAATAAVSFLHYFSHELLVHHFTMPGAPRHCGYVFD